MIGSTPTFHKTPLRKALSKPWRLFSVLRLHKLTPVDDLARLGQNGMKHLNNRIVILGCFGALKQLVYDFVCTSQLRRLRININ